MNAVAALRLGVPWSRPVFAQASGAKLLTGRAVRWACVVVDDELVGRGKQDTPTSAMQRRLSRLLSLYAYGGHVEAALFPAERVRLIDTAPPGDDAGASSILGGPIITSMRIVRDSNEAEMVAVFLSGELSSERFGSVVRDALLACGQSERLLAEPDLNDTHANQARRAVLAATRGYGEDRELFTHFPAQVRWEWIELTAPELARVRYIDYSYWNELSGGSRLAADAARRISAGVRPWGVSNERFHTAARALRNGERFPPLILAGAHRDDLVCLEGNLRLTAHALAGFPIEIECLVGTAPALEHWAQ